MKVTISHRTQFSKSPVLFIHETVGVGNSESYYNLRVALTSDGDIYRLINHNEQTKQCEPFEVLTSEITDTLINDWRKYRSYMCGYKLQRLAKIQEYELKLGYSTISNSPLHKMVEGHYYIASKALELHESSESWKRKYIKEKSESFSLKEQLQIVQAKLKVPKVMAEMNCSEKQAIAFVLGGKLYRSLLVELFANKIIHPNGYTGSGRYTSKGTDKAAAIAVIITKAGIKYYTGNDAPNKGYSGEYISLNKKSIK